MIIREGGQYTCGSLATCAGYREEKDPALIVLSTIRAGPGN